jgi:hypothetical protein
MQKELLSRCLLETTNRHIFADVYNDLKRNEQNISKAPGLLAHPSTVINMEDCRLDQISSSKFKQFLEAGFVAIDEFFD